MKKTITGERDKRGARTRFMTDPTGRKGLRVALTFGIVAATIEMAIVLWMTYC